MTALRHEIAVLIRRHTEVIRNLGAEAQRTRWLTKLEELAALVEGDTFKVLIVGQFSRGKSTLINALLGQKILPSYATATTAVINEVKSGDTSVRGRVSSGTAGNSLLILLRWCWPGRVLVRLALVAPGPGVVAVAGPFAGMLAPARADARAWVVR